MLAMQLLACKNRTDWELAIIKEGRVWDVLNGSKRTVNALKFNKDNSCYCCLYYFEGTIGICPGGDNILPETWKFENDTLQIRGWEGAVIEFNQDTIVIRNFHFNKVDTFVRNCEVNVKYDISKLKGW